MQTDLTAVTQLLDTVIAFAIAYGFQLLGALVVFMVGITVSNWVARRAVIFGDRKGFDQTLTNFSPMSYAWCCSVLLSSSPWGILASPLRTHRSGRCRGLWRDLGAPGRAF